MTDKFLLTVAVPTHNGSRYIKQAIDSIIIQQKYFNNHKIEILVSDNASTDNTEQIVKNYIGQQNILISYYRNKENIGYDGNIREVFKKSKGQYVWLLGDDDYLVDGSIKKFFEVIKQNEELSVILLSLGFLDIKTGKKFNVNTLKEDVKCLNGDEFFKISKWSSAALSSLIINKDDWNNAESEKYIGTQWIHIGALVNILSKNRKYSYIIAKEMVTVRTNNDRWEDVNGSQLYLGLVHLKVLQEMNYLNYSDETFKFFLKDRYKKNLRDIIKLKPKDFRNKIKIAKLMIVFFKEYPIFWLVHLPILFMPKICIYLHMSLKRIKEI